MAFGCQGDLIKDKKLFLQRAYAPEKQLFVSHDARAGHNNVILEVTNADIVSYTKDYNGN